MQREVKFISVKPNVELKNLIVPPYHFIWGHAVA
jgi:hypothetical protein